MQSFRAAIWKDTEIVRKWDADSLRNPFTSIRRNRAQYETNIVSLHTRLLAKLFLQVVLTVMSSPLGAWARSIQFSHSDAAKGQPESHNRIVRGVDNRPEPSDITANNGNFIVAGRLTSDSGVMPFDNTIHGCEGRGYIDSRRPSTGTQAQVGNVCLNQADLIAYMAPIRRDCKSFRSARFLGDGVGGPPGCGLTFRAGTGSSFASLAGGLHAPLDTPTIDSAADTSESLTGFDKVIGAESYTADVGGYEPTPGEDPVGLLGASPTGIDFGIIALADRNTKSITITDIGGVRITILQVNILGAGFRLLGPLLPLTLVPGQSTTFSVTLEPSVTGNSTGVVLFASDARNSPTSVLLSGMGISVSHYVNLTWEGGGSNVVGYNIYRGMQSGGPYVKLNSFPIVQTEYTDTGVRESQTYFYVATAIRVDGVESEFSKEAQATVPRPGTSTH